MPKKFEIIVNPNIGKQYNIYIWDNIEEYEDYDKLLETLSKITKDDEVVVYISTPGGRCDIGFMLYDRLEMLPCPIQIVVPYPTYSMGALLSLVGDALELREGAFLMFHDYSTGQSGKGNEIYKSTEAYKEVFEHRFKNICKPFLTEKECNDILNGKDLYIKWNDPTLELRIKRHFK